MHLHVCALEHRLAVGAELHLVGKRRELAGARGNLGLEVIDGHADPAKADLVGILHRRVLQGLVELAPALGGQLVPERLDSQDVEQVRLVDDANAPARPSYEPCAERA